MGGRGGNSYSNWYKNETSTERESRFERLTYKSKLSSEKKNELLKRMEKDPMYLNKKGSEIINKIQYQYGKYSTSDTGYITVGDKETAKEAIADMKKRGAKYGVFQDASLTYNRHSREWEIYHGW